jgi:PleD family two-component response regulator
LQEIKNNGQSRDAKVIILSNLGQEENIKRAKQLGADDYIVKSDININKLTERIIRELQ